MTASSIASALPFARSATIIMCLANRLRNRECLGKRPVQEVSELERRSDDDVVVVELSHNQPAVVPPVEQAVP